MSKPRGPEERKAGVRDQLKGPLGTRISMTLDRSPGVVVVELGEL